MADDVNPRTVKSFLSTRPRDYTRRYADTIGDCSLNGFPLGSVELHLLHAKTRCFHHSPDLLGCGEEIEMVGGRTVERHVYEYMAKRRDCFSEKAQGGLGSFEMLQYLRD